MLKIYPLSQLCESLAQHSNNVHLYPDCSSAECETTLIKSDKYLLYKEGSESNTWESGIIVAQISKIEKTKSKKFILYWKKIDF